MSYTKLKDLISEGLLYVGASIYVKENNVDVEHKIVNIGYGDVDNVVVLMRMYADTNVRVAFNDKVNDNNAENRIYVGNSLDNYLNITHYNKYPSTVRNAIVSVPIQVTDKNGKIYSISKRVFAPSATEVGFGPMDGYNPQEGEKFSYFNASAENRRIFREGFGKDGLEWNTRTRNCGTGLTDKFYCIGVKDDGEYERARWQTLAKYVRPVFCINEEVTVDYVKTTSSTGNNGLYPVTERFTVVGNLPPEVPSVKSAPSEVMSEEPFSIEWTESKNGSADIDSSTAPKYQVQCRIDGGEWVDAIASTGLTIYSASVGYKEAEKIIYRVRAIDGYSNYSAWVLFPEIKVINNVAPEAPSFINVTGQFTEAPIAVTWGASADSDYNLTGYKLYRSVDGGEFELVYDGQNTSFNEVSGTWNTVAYKVNAYDAYGYESAFAETEKALVVKCTIKLSVNDESAFAGENPVLDDSVADDGVILAHYNLEDSTEGLTYTLTLAVDGTVFLTVENVTVGTVELDIPFAVWQTWLNGEHVLTVSATDNNDSTASLDTAFVKQTYSLELTLAKPIVLSEEAKRFMFAVTGEFPEGITVSVTNNANDDNVVWQELTEEQYNGEDYIDFTNESIANGFAFNFLIEASSSDGSGKLSSVSGIVGENLFELVLSKIEDLDRRVEALES